jgi:YHS domain-containing protein
MARVRDPVCGMMVDPDTAAATATHNSRDFYFCSEECGRAFQDDPEVYAGKEQEEPYTTKGFTAPNSDRPEAEDWSTSPRRTRETGARPYAESKMSRRSTTE